MKAPKDYPSLFGYISPATGDVSSHPPLCACGSCAMPVERFTLTDEDTFKACLSRLESEGIANA
ncbi:MAG: hypothetical protein M3O20_15115 [Acidobacteriota bacterium]|nr:hypothetical protein [Acidobacteriota bacterium]